MVAKLFNLLALSSAAVLLCTLGSEPVAALSVDSHARHARSHHAIAHGLTKRTKRTCKPRPPKNGQAAGAPTSTKSATTSTKAPTSPAAEAGEPTTKADTPTTQAGTPEVTSSKPPVTTAQPTTTKATPAPEPTSPPASSGAKMGLSWPNGDDAALSKFKTGKSSYIYTWSPYMPNKAKSLGFKHAPMLWGDKQLDAFKKLVVAGYADAVLGFNEPDLGSQANMDPGHAADVWRQHINPLKDQGYRLISPAVSNGPGGKVWFQNFLNACSGCHFDAHAVHHYDTDPQTLIAYLKDWHTTFGKPIWLTEFACTSFGGKAAPSVDDVWAYESTAKNFLESTPWIEVYMPFGAMKDMSGVNENNRLMNAGSGAPTDLYWGYAS